MNGKKPLVLMAEDNREVLRLNSRALTRAGYDVFGAETLGETERWLRERRADVILLDILMPDGNGLEFLPRLRGFSDAPVLFLSNLREHTDVLRGIEAGGDDYMVKPYQLDELLVRVNALWRREKLHREKLREAAAAPPEPVLRRGPLELNRQSGRAYLHGADAGLKPKEFALLLLLARREGQVLSGEELYEAVWGQPVNGDKRTIWAHVSRLRARLRMDGPGSPFSLDSIRGSGYCFRFRDVEDKHR